MIVNNVNNERGLTLLEVLAATVILSILVLAIYSLTNYTLRADHSVKAQNDDHLVASNHLQAVREAILQGASLPVEIPSEIAQEYDIDVQVTPLGEPLALSPLFARTHESMQSVIYDVDTGEVHVITVTVARKVQSDE